ncbi:MAG: DUF559 domain-containing protein [Trueperaceae bacterium]|nr:DUF559 domain-containing protein [Trueperaceae bacterium]
MPKYQPVLKESARVLRKTMTDAELALWQRLRRKQVLGVQFYRQRPIERFIADFYAHKVKLVIEVDGSQHYEEHGKARDAERTQYLEGLGIEVIRFSNLEVLKELDVVIARIYALVEERLESQ